jgi:hypothetical protein
MMKETLTFTGHPLISSKHRTTLEVTKSPNLTEKGDCIIGVNATKAGIDFDPAFRRMLADDRTSVRVTLKIGREKIIVCGKGHPLLTLTHAEELVLRKSSFASPRTLAVGVDKVAIDIPRRIVAMLRDSRVVGTMEIELERV